MGKWQKRSNHNVGWGKATPLSPYLFLFCMDILSRMIGLTTYIKLFEGLATRRGGPTIFHLFFADDSLFFFKASSAVC